MKIGTKSVLFGAHCFIIHPFFVFAAWWRLYGFPYDPRLWISFFVHDLGYIGKPNMDGPEGETHPEFGARIMKVFGQYWADFCRYHSRFNSKRDGVKYSRLCVADKLAVALEPRWLYLPRVRWTGEIHEYMKLAGKRKYEGELLNKYESMALSIESHEKWFEAMTSYLKRWAEEHRDGKDDTWTPVSKQAINENGVWK